MTLADASTNTETLTAVITLGITIGTVGFGYLIKYWLSRRNNSGSIDTSAAETLWTQTQAFITSLTAEKDKIETQRDRLIDSQASHVVPALDALNKSMTAVLRVLTEVSGTMAEVRQFIEEARSGDKNTGSIQ